jgi:plasmid replication initiation protein
MAEDIVPVSLTKGSSLKQSHALARSASDMTTNQKRLLKAMIKSAEYIDKKLEAALPLYDFVAALNIDDSSKTRKDLIEEIGELTKKDIHVPEDDNSWTNYPWFSRIRYDEKSKTVSFLFNPSINDLLFEFKKDFAVLPLSYYGRMQGKYAIQIYDLCISWAAEKGKHGNKPGEWFVKKMPIDYIRHQFAVGKKYPLFADFRKRVLEDGCEEINNANFGFFVEPSYTCKGRKVTDVGFKCWDVETIEPKPVVKKTKREIDRDEKTETMFKSNLERYGKEYERIISEVESDNELFDESGIPLYEQRIRKLKIARERFDDYCKSMEKYK